jgi:hypothetical protein
VMGEVSRLKLSANRPKEQSIRCVGVLLGVGDLLVDLVGGVLSVEELRHHW